MSAQNAIPVKTLPGADHVFAPPEGWQGTEADYRNLMRKRWGGNQGEKHRMAFTARFVINRCHEPESVIEGPYAEPAMEIIAKLARST